MRAFLVEGPGQWGLEEVDEPQPGHGELLIAPAVVGLCGSDLELLTGRRPPPYVRYPTIPGHEWAGYVLSRGPGVFGFPPGTAVIAEGIRSCGRCARCAEGRNNLCAGPYAETGFTHPGALAERLVVPAHLVHPLPADRSIAAAGLLEPAACVATGLLDVGIPRAGSRLAVVGDGPLGLLACALLRLTSPRELLLFGARPARLAFGERMGATATMRTPPAEHPERIALRGGFDAVVECTDSPAGAAFAVELARRAGSVVLIGISGARALTLDPDAISLGSLRVQGVFGASRAAWRWLLELYSAGLFAPDALITHRFGLDRVADAFSVLTNPDAGALKVIVESGMTAEVAMLYSNSMRSTLTQV
jgi:threonine dehydrogenase-like Zn-dependent dehydrogenase